MAGTATVNVTVNAAPNVTPSASAIVAGSMSEDGSLAEIDLLGDAGASDRDGGTLGVTSVSAQDQNGAAVSFGLVGSVLSIDPGQFAEALSSGDSATVTVSYTVTDGQGGETPNTATLVVDGLDGPFTWYVDGDGDGFGVDDAATNLLAYTAPAGTSGAAGDADDADDTVFPGAPEINDFKDNDQDGLTDEDNTAPVADAETFEIAEDGTLVLPMSSLLAGDTDADGDTLTVAAVSGAVNGPVALDDKGDADASNDEVIFTPTPGYSGPASFDYTVADGFGGEDTVTVDVTVINREDGSAGNDTLDGTSGKDEIYGYAGDDVLNGEEGSDTLDGGSGNDALWGGGGRDTAVFATSSNTIIGQVRSLTDSLEITTTDGTDVIHDDVEFFEFTDKTLTYAEVFAAVTDVNEDLTTGELFVGGVADDTLDGPPLNDTLAGGAGNDTLTGGNGDDEIAGSDGADEIDGGADNDNIGGGTGDDTITGGTGNDTIGGGQGDDSAEGGAGNDVVNGGPGNDTLDGGTGNDTMGASFGNDVVNGGEGNDSILGGDGNDFLAGGGRNDTIEGGAGDDTINGGDGDDMMTGGNGADVFVFNFFKDGDEDVITDYEDGVDSFLIRITNLESGEANIDNGGNGLPGFLDALNITDVEGGAQLDIDGHLVLVQGVSAAELTTGDFIFL